MNPSTFWVTGGAGFLGSRVVTHLLNRGHEVHCLVRSAAAAYALRSVFPSDTSRLKIILGSLADPSACRALVSSADRGFHIASALTGSTAALFSANVVATRTLLQSIRESRCNRFVLISSIAVHGTSRLPRHAVLDERCDLDAAPHLRDPYTFSKVVQEQVCWTAHEEWGLPLVVIRPGVIYGPGRECLSARVGLRIGPFWLRMGGRQPLPYTYVDNCSNAIVQAGIVEGIEGESFNIVDDQLPTGRQLIEEQRRKAGPLRAVGVPLWVLGSLSRIYTSYSRYSKGQLPSIFTPYRVAALWNSLGYSSAKAKERLGWHGQVRLADGLRLTFDSLKEPTLN